MLYREFESHPFRQICEKALDYRGLFCIHLIVGVAKNDLKDELSRVQKLINRVGFQNDRTARFIFQDLVRPREVVLRFDAPRVVMADELEKKLEQLFGFYVEHDLITPEYIEQGLERKLRGILVEADLRQEFHEAEVERGAFHARFPFAHKDECGVITKAIKPLHLGHKDPANAYDRGWTWIGKIRQLKNYQALPGRVLIATQGPDESNPEAVAVYHQIRDDFKKLDVEVAALSDPRAIEEFARAL